MKKKSFLAKVSKSGHRLNKAKIIDCVPSLKNFPTNILNTIKPVIVH